jgi:hypothetical protein
MTSRSLASSRYEKRYIRDCERARCRISQDRQDVLAYADEEIRIEVFGKTSSTILLNSQLSMRNRYGTEAHGR